MVSALETRASGPSSSPGRGHCVVFFGGKILYSHSAGSVHPGGDPVMDQHPIQGGVEILLVSSCYRN